MIAEYIASPMTSICQFEWELHDSLGLCISEQFEVQLLPSSDY